MFTFLHLKHLHLEVLRYLICNLTISLKHLKKKKRLLTLPLIQPLCINVSHPENLNIKAYDYGRQQISVGVSLLPVSQSGLLSFHNSQIRSVGRGRKWNLTPSLRRRRLWEEHSRQKKKWKSKTWLQIKNKEWSKEYMNQQLFEGRETCQIIYIVFQSITFQLDEIVQ